MTSTPNMIIFADSRNFLETILNSLEALGEAEEKTESKESSDTFHYVAKCRKCNSIVFACCDLPEYSLTIAREVAEYIASGYIIERIPSDTFQNNKFACRCNESKKMKDARAWN